MELSAPLHDPDFRFPGIEFAASPRETAHPAAVLGATETSDLGPLAQLEGTWSGTGFNTIWRPFQLPSPPIPQDAQDRFLELNITTERIVFESIGGAIPNRGLLMPDIDMFGLTYMQQVAEASTNAALHIEPGIWATVPPTTDPALGATVVRMASIPHGTVMLAQGPATAHPGGPNVVDNNIIPFFIGDDPPPDSDFWNAVKFFPELNLAEGTKFRWASPGVTQDMVINPNGVLQAALEGQTIVSTTTLTISTRPGVPGGGTANTAFLADASDPPGGNAAAVEVDAIFWIEEVAGTDGAPNFLQLQYTQLVQLDFNKIRWPHVTVATLRKEQ